MSNIIPLKEAAVNKHHSSASEMKNGLKKDQNNRIKATKRAKKYFEGIEISTVRRLYNLYKTDFDLFQYSTDGFL